MLGASLALLGFSLLTAIALGAWFKAAPDPWSWKGAVALSCALLGLTTSVLVWRAPSRVHAAAGITVMLLSLVRLIGSDFSWPSVALIAITGLLLVPLVRAVIALRDS